MDGYGLKAARFVFVFPWMVPFSSSFVREGPLQMAALQLWAWMDLFCRTHDVAFWILAFGVGRILWDGYDGWDSQGLLLYE